MSVPVNEMRGTYAFTGDAEVTAVNGERGGVRQRSVGGPNIRVNEISAERDCELQVVDKKLPDAVHIFIPLSGAGSVSYPGCELCTDILPDHHHHVYAPVTTYEWRFSGSVRLVNIEVGADYLISLLSGTDPWSLTLKDKLARRQPVAGRQKAVCRRMHQIVRDIFVSDLPHPLNHIYAEGKALELVALQLYHAMGDHVTGNDAPGKIAKREREILDAIHAHLTKDFREEHSLARLSRIYGMNEFALKKGFKSVYGKTVFEHLFDVRMDYARQMLDEGSMVCEVAREIGYRNPNHFSTAFKKKFGINPLFFRKHQGRVAVARA